MGKDYEGRVASAPDFCIIFRQQVEAFYVLSLLVTGDHEKAEQCFLAAFSDCLQTTHIFRESASSWARRAIIRRGTEIVRLYPETPAPRAPGGGVIEIRELPTLREQHLERILALATFERLVLVLSVLEKYSDRDCARLLGCSLQQIRKTRISALQQIAEPSSTACPDGVPPEQIRRVPLLQLSRDSCPNASSHYTSIAIVQPDPPPTSPVTHRGDNPATAA